MKSYKYYYILLALSILNFSSCTKTLMPSGVTGKAKKEYDAAAFNEVYVEALKQKLMGNNGDALKYLEQCVKINPKSDAAYYQMAQIVIANGDNKNGKQYVSKALSIDQENIWYLTMVQRLNYKKKIINSNIIFYKKVVKFFPKKKNLHLTLETLYSEKKIFEK